ncbi:MAG: hypothetical protein ACREP8_16535, partial [Candidatus Binatia bacterium]
ALIAVLADNGFKFLALFHSSGAPFRRSFGLCKTAAESVGGEAVPMGAGLDLYASEMSDMPFEPCFPSSKGEGKNRMRMVD